jgi:hypothetical protein
VISVTRYWYDSAEKFFCWTDCAVPEEQTEQELEEELCGFTEAAVERKMRAVVGSEEAFRAVRAERESMAVSGTLAAAKRAALLGLRGIGAQNWWRLRSPLATAQRTKFFAAYQPAPSRSLLKSVANTAVGIARPDVAA